jgi:hypothetical protein
MKRWDGEEEHILISGLAEGLSATCRHGKDRDGYIEAEAMADGGALIHGHARRFRGFRGGGQTQHMYISLQRLPRKTK